MLYNLRKLKEKFEFKRAAILFIFIWLSAFKGAHASEKAVLKATVNGQDAGEHIVIIEDSGDVLFPLDALKEMRIKGLPAGEPTGDVRYVSLKSLSPGIRFEMNEKDSTVAMTVDSGAFEKAVIDLSSKADPRAVTVRNDSAFLNYSLNYNRGDDADNFSMSAPWELGANLYDTFLFSGFSYSKTKSEERFSRHTTNVTKDFAGSQRRLIVGDYAARAGALGGGGQFAGVSLSKNYSMTPYFLKAQGLDLKGTVRTASEVKLYVSGNLIRTLNVEAGEFEITDVPQASSGAGEATLVIKDAYGNEERVVMPFYLSSSMVLKPGLHEYGYSIGLKRKNAATENLDYADTAFAAFHRYGLTKSATVGASLEADKDSWNAGPTATLLLWGWGEAGLDWALSRSEGKAGHGGLATYTYAKKGLSAGVSLRGLSREFSNLNTAPSKDKVKLEGTLRLGYNDGVMNSVSASYTKTERYYSAGGTRSMLYYTMRVSDDSTLLITAARSMTDGDKKARYDFFAGYNIMFGEGASGGVNNQWHGADSVSSVHLQKSPPPGPGTGYRLFGERKKGEDKKTETNGNASASLRGGYGVYTADYRRGSGENSYSVGAGGSIALVDGSLHLSRPIRDSFALVKASGIEGITVSGNNQSVGRTNKDGEVIVPDMASYQANRISIEDTDIPVNFAISEVSKSVVIPYRGGGVVSFGVDKVQGFEARAYFIEKGVKKTADYAGLELRLDKSATETIVGKDGQVYLENLKPGKYRARLFTKGKDCSFDMDIPESGKMLVNLGEAACEIR